LFEKRVPLWESVPFWKSVPLWGNVPLLENVYFWESALFWTYLEVPSFGPFHFCIILQPYQLLARFFYF